MMILEEGRHDVDSTGEVILDDDTAVYCDCEDCTSDQGGASW